jgi:hypothetical protein
MSDEAWGFAPPPFEAEEALQRLRRELRELGLQERQGAWERRGVSLARLVLQGHAIEASRVKKPSRSSPEWVSRSLKSSADVRHFTSDLKKHLAQWSDDHD